MKLIGIGHKRKSGKDTLAYILHESLINYDTQVYRFADELKQTVCRLLNISISELELNKELYRPMLQWYGTEYIRKHKNRDNHWIEQLNLVIESERELNEGVNNNNFIPIICDVRFPNEAEWVKSKGGLLIKIERSNSEQTKLKLEVNNHSSETSLDDYNKWDYTVFNNTSIENLKWTVRTTLLPNIIKYLTS